MKGAALGSRMMAEIKRTPSQAPGLRATRSIKLNELRSGSSELADSAIRARPAILAGGGFDPAWPEYRSTGFRQFAPHSRPQPKEKRNASQASFLKHLKEWHRPESPHSPMSISV